MIFYKYLNLFQLFEKITIIEPKSIDPMSEKFASAGSLNDLSNDF